MSGLAWEGWTDRISQADNLRHKVSERPEEFSLIWFDLLSVVAIVQCLRLCYNFEEFLVMMYAVI